MTELSAREEIAKAFDLIECAKKREITVGESSEILTLLAKNIHLFSDLNIFNNLSGPKSSARFYSALGYECLLYGQWNAALHFLTKTLSLDASHKDAGMHMSQLLLFMRRWDDAKKIVGMVRANGTVDNRLESVILVANGNAYLAQDNLKAAEQNLRLACAKYLGWGYPFNQHLKTLAKMQGVDPALDKTQPERFITNVQLASNGRFAHTLWEYFLLRFYADRVGATPTTPNWFGRYLFEGMDDPFQSNLVESYHGDPESVVEVFKREVGVAPINVNFPEKVRYHSVCPFRRISFDSRNAFYEMIKPRSFLKLPINSFSKNIKEKGETLVVLHIRRTDMVTSYPDSFVAEQTYVDWLNSFWNDLDRPVLYIASDDIDAVLPAFEAFNPLSIYDVADVPKGFEFYMDFHMLMHGDILGLAHSDFSRLASFLNPVAKRYGVPSKESGLIEEKSLKEVLQIS